MKVVMKKLVLVTAALALFVGSAYASDDFPLRAKYPAVTYITTADLAAQFNDILVVDVRSAAEFGVAHVNGAKHVALAKGSFTKDLEALRGKTDSKLMAFYCNGHTCSKSYKAYVKAAKSGFENIVSYDAGIFDWINAQPEKATLMGATPAPSEKIIPKSELKKYMIDFAEMKELAGAAGAMVIDIREPFQRQTVPDIPKMRNIPFDRLIGMVKQKKFQDKNLLIVDAVGKQVRWLQYHLVENGYSNYKFLSKGVAGIK